MAPAFFTRSPTTGVCMKCSTASVLLRPRPRANVPRKSRSRRIFWLWTLPFPRVRRGVEGVAQAVAEEVEAEDEDGDGQTGKNREVRSVEQVRLAVTQHRPPAGGRGLHAESQEAEGSFREDGPTHPQSRLDGDGREGRRDDVAGQNAERRGAKSSSGLDVLELAGPKHLPSHEP